MHLVEPLGFHWDDRALKRAGLDYHEFAHIERHKNWEACKNTLAHRRFFAITTRGTQRYTRPEFRSDDVFVFGNETSGLPSSVMAEFTEKMRLRIPMRAGQRSLNLSNCVAVMVYEAWRQLGFTEGQ